MGSTEEKILSMVCFIPALVLGLTLHEFAHAWVGWKLGDDTPKRLGRVTLDPVAHIDPFGALFILVSAWFGFGIGWAKPVPIVPRNLGNPRRDSILVAIAGPISNLLQVPFWMLALFIFSRVTHTSGQSIDTFAGPLFTVLLTQTLCMGVVVNLGLAAFNMLPIPPLDGHWVLEGLGGEPVKQLFDSIRPYSFFLLIMVLNFGLLRPVLGPVYHFADTLCAIAMGQRY